MRKFVHLNTCAIGEAVSVPQRYGAKASVIAGGTHLLGKMKDEILSAYSEVIINLKSILGLDFIREAGTWLRLPRPWSSEQFLHAGNLVLNVHSTICHEDTTR